MIRSRRVTCAFAFVAGVALACAGDSTSVDKSPLDGLTRVSSTDSGGTPPTNPPPSDTGTTPSPPPNPGPGSFRGYVRGQAEPGTGPDTMATAPKVANVRVTAYPRLPSSSADSLGVGPAAASVLTDANGEFQLPTLPGGEYVVTFVPPESSIYRGVYATATAHSQSNTYPWWVVLPKK